MGEVAEDMFSGACCALCCTFFRGDHGHEVLCKSCKKENPEDPRPVATLEEH